MKWIPKDEPLKRRLALDASLLSLPYNQDDLTAFPYLKDERLDLYQWLINQPFVMNTENGQHIYHEVAQDMFSRNLYQSSSTEYYLTRQAIIHYYQQKVEIMQVEDGKEVYKSIDWLELVLASTRQLFLLPKEDNLRSAIEQILKAYEVVEEREKIVNVLRSLSQVAV